MPVTFPYFYSSLFPSIFRLFSFLSKFTALASNYKVMEDYDDLDPAELAEVSFLFWKFLKIREKIGAKINTGVSAVIFV